MIQFIWGIGTGRCGTGTVAELLDKQKGIWAKHESGFCPWEKDIVAFYQSIMGLLAIAEEMRIATVAFYWKNYLSEIFRDFANPKVIVLKREKTKVVESFASMYRDHNHWSTVGGKNWDGKSPQNAPLAIMFPKYDLSKKDAIAQYWEEYYNDGAIDYWLDKFPQNIMVIRSEDLWGGEDAQRHIFEFLDIPEEDMVFDTSIWAHKRPEQSKNVELDRPPPPEFREINLSKALCGHAVAYAGLPTGVEIEVTDNEMELLKAHPDFEKVNKEA